MVSENKHYLANSSSLHEDIDDIIKEICEIHSSDNIQHDIIALFEDIIKFFSNREEEFVKLKSMPAKDQQEIYAEIKTIITILKSLKNNKDKQEIISLLSKRLITKFSKSTHLKKEEFLSKEEQLKLKEIFARMILHEIHARRKISHSKMSDKHKIETLKNNYKSFTDKKLSPYKSSFQKKLILSKKGNNQQRTI